MTINELFKNYNDAIIPDTMDTRFSFLTEYRLFYEKLDNLYKLNKGSLQIDPFLVGKTESETIINVQDIILSTLLAHELSLKHYYDVLSLEYDPISNYDKNSTITNILGNTRTEDSYGEKKVDTTNINGERISSSSNKYGQKITDNEIEQAKSETLNKVSGYNSNELNTSDGSETISQPTASHIKENERTDTQNITNNEYTDTINTTENQHTDIHTTDEITNKTTERTNGNIGVTTTQEMIQSEIDLWTKIDFYKYIFDLITSSIAYGFY